MGLAAPGPACTNTLPGPALWFPGLAGSEGGGKSQRGGPEVPTSPMFPVWESHPCGSGGCCGCCKGMGKLRQGWKGLQPAGTRGGVCVCLIPSAPQAEPGKGLQQGQGGLGAMYPHPLCHQCPCPPRSPCRCRTLDVGHWPSGSGGRCVQPVSQTTVSRFQQQLVPHGRCAPARWCRGNLDPGLAQIRGRVNRPGPGGRPGGRSARPLLQGWVLGPWKDPMGALVSRHGVPGARGHGPLGTHEAGDLFSTQGPGLLQCRVRERCLIQRSQRWLGADADRHRHRYRPLGSLGRAVPKHPPHGRCCLCWP